MIKPNHHYATHVPSFVKDYGPLAEFWTFLFERLNKVLKSFKTNNHGGGELEVSFFREFHRTVRASAMVCAITKHVFLQLKLGNSSRKGFKVLQIHLST